MGCKVYSSFPPPLIFFGSKYRPTLENIPLPCIRAFPPDSFFCELPRLFPLHVHHDLDECIRSFLFSPPFRFKLMGSVCAYCSLFFLFHGTAVFSVGLRGRSHLSLSLLHWLRMAGAELADSCLVDFFSVLGQMGLSFIRVFCRLLSLSPLLLFSPAST